MTALRTPDDRFGDLAGFPFPPNYVDDLPGYEGLRAHYLDLGPRDAGRTFLCLHGEPTCVAPDFFGFGRSDKPIEDSAYTFPFHRTFLLRLVERLALGTITLVVQDWGGTLGLTLPVDAAFRSALDRLFVMNTSLPVGEPLGPHFHEWRSQVRNTPELPVGQWIRDSAPGLTDAEVAAYDAPFPDGRFQAGARTFPGLAMVEPEMDGVAESRAALEFWTEEWSGDSFMAIGANDPDVEAVEALRGHIRGCPAPLVLGDAGHFVPEAGERVARAALRSFGDL
ncbi:alpha/beta fold hydrolase [Amycolatopsis sp. NPDC049252]|uniref:alpha/beta fold hydrolase n=1 Tax=Amycolatopsis sp. NPDC049252 TaxID=3363933 RepID=UPI003717C4DC